MQLRTLMPLLLVAVAALSIGFLTARHFQPETAPASTATGTPAKVGERRPDFRHGNINGEWVEAGDFDGQVLLLNFWATWCAPCRKEMPMLQRLQQELGPSGLQIVGVAIDDPQRVRDFLTELGIDYPNLVGGPDLMATNRAWGNPGGALPFSVLVDREGVIRLQELGELQEAGIRSEIEQLLDPS